MKEVFQQYRAEPWINEAACRSIGTEPFFPAGNEDWNQAREMCRRCVVRLQCLDYAMRMEEGHDHKTRFGVYGAMSPLERKRYEPEWLAEQTEGAA